jgi:hypothetical protein
MTLNLTQSSPKEKVKTNQKDLESATCRRFSMFPNVAACRRRRVGQRNEKMAANHQVRSAELRKIQRQIRPTLKMIGLSMALQDKSEPKVNASR